MVTNRMQSRNGRRGLAVNKRRRGGAVELEAVLVTGAMFPLAVALLALAVKGLRALYDMSVTLLEWPYL